MADAPAASLAAGACAADSEGLMSTTLLRETARLLIDHTLRLPERIARHHVSLLGQQSAIFADGDFASATLTLTKVGAFTADACAVGTVVYLADNGSGRVTPGYYTITERSSDDAVLLDRDARSGLLDPVDVVCWMGQLATFAAISTRNPRHWREDVLFRLPPLRQPVYPEPGEVWHGAGDYGPNGDDYEPAMRASDIANCEPANVKLGVVIDDVTGTYAGP